MAVCNWPLDKEGLAPVNSIVPDEWCDPPKGFKGFVMGAQIVDEFGHKLEGDWDPKGHSGCKHTDTPEWKAAHRKVHHKEKVMAEHAEVTVPVSVPVPSPAPSPAPEAPATVATVGAPDLLGQVQQLIPKDGNATAVTAVLAALVVVGGLLYKLGPNLLKARNEREMKKLEIEEKKLEQQNDQHQACTAARVALEGRVTLLAARIEQVDAMCSSISHKVEETSISFGEGSSPEEIVERLEALEAKSAKKAAPKKKE
jgi:hypothetical protein